MNMFYYIPILVFKTILILKYFYTKSNLFVACYVGFLIVHIKTLYYKTLVWQHFKYILKKKNKILRRVDWSNKIFFKKKKSLN